MNRQMQISFSAFVICWLATLSASHAQLTALTEFDGSDDRLKAHGDVYRDKAETLNLRADEYVAEGQGHGFFNRSPWRERTLIAVDQFLTSLGLLESESTQGR